MYLYPPPALSSERITETEIARTIGTHGTLRRVTSHGTLLYAVCSDANQRPTKWFVR